jgi:hypothetical protein
MGLDTARKRCRCKWDPEFGPEMTGSQAMLKNFAFPFSGKSWNSFSVGMTGSMTFAEPAGEAAASPSIDSPSCRRAVPFVPNNYSRSRH